MLTASEVIDAIMRGDVDDDLDGVFDATRQRMRYVERAQAIQNQAQFKPGTRVEVCGRISPRTLLGALGTVKGPGRRNGDLTVKFDHPVFIRRGYVEETGIPAMCLKRSDVPAPDPSPAAA